MRKFLFAGMGVAAAVVAPGGPGLRMRRPGRSRRRRASRQGDDVRGLVGRCRALRHQLRLHGRGHRCRMDRAAARRSRPRSRRPARGRCSVWSANSRHRRCLRRSQALRGPLPRPPRPSSSRCRSRRSTSPCSREAVRRSSTGAPTTGSWFRRRSRTTCSATRRQPRSSWPRNTTRHWRCSATSRPATACRC